MRSGKPSRASWPTSCQGDVLTVSTGLWKRYELPRVWRLHKSRLAHAPLYLLADVVVEAYVNLLDERRGR